MEKNYNLNSPKFSVTPKFNFIYELGMPTGKKIKATLMSLIIFVILSIAFFVMESLPAFQNATIEIKNLSYVGIVIFLITVGIAIKLVFHVVLQVMQYKNISYTFYDDLMVYEDKFLNQHKKTIRYENIKEVEIRRRIWDRMLGYGVIIIYTSAENRNNGLILYGIDNPQEKYDRIQEILCTYKDNEKKITLEKVDNLKVDREEKVSPEEFINDLKSLNN